MEIFSKRLALITSYIFHPLFMATNGMLIAYFIGMVPGFNRYSTDADKEIAHFALLCVFIATAVLPIIIAIVLKLLKVVSSLHMPRREERAIPFLLTTFCYYGVFYYLQSYLALPLDKAIFLFMYAGILATLIGFFITFTWKISVHMIGIGGVVGIITVLSKVGDEVLLLPLSIAILISGLIAFGRLQLQAHNIKQIIAGFLLGFGCEVMGLFFS